ncbi:hypothetical protein ACA910_019782 [Epithemia clementina (nom. ined.)]
MVAIPMKPTDSADVNKSSNKSSSTQKRESTICPAKAVNMLCLEDEARIVDVLDCGHSFELVAKDSSETETETEILSSRKSIDRKESFVLEQAESNLNEEKQDQEEARDEITMVREQEDQVEENIQTETEDLNKESPLLRQRILAEVMLSTTKLFGYAELHGQSNERNVGEHTPPSTYLELLEAALSDSEQSLSVFFNQQEEVLWQALEKRLSLAKAELDDQIPIFMDYLKKHNAKFEEALSESEASITAFLGGQEGSLRAYMNQQVRQTRVKLLEHIPGFLQFAKDRDEDIIVTKRKLLLLQDKAAEDDVSLET